MAKKRRESKKRAPLRDVRGQLRFNFGPLSFRPVLRRDAFLERHWNEFDSFSESALRSRAMELRGQISDMQTRNRNYYPLLARIHGAEKILDWYDRFWKKYSKQPEESIRKKLGVMEEYLKMPAHPTEKALATIAQRVLSELLALK